MPKRSQNPLSNRLPENRRGTRSHRSYLISMVGGNLSGCSSIVRATSRQESKARKLFENGVLPAAAKGRVQRALLRMIWMFWGHECDDLMGQYHGRNY